MSTPRCNMFFCPDCHVSNRADAKFCRKCGKSRSDLERGEVKRSGLDHGDVSNAAVKANAVIVESAIVEGAIVEGAIVESEFVDAAIVEGAIAEGAIVESETMATEKNLELDVSQGAPDLSVNIEQRESFSVPPAPSPEQTTPQCPSCWEPLRATDKFCCWCGEAQPNRVLPFMKLCLECSTFLPEKANYCYSCGADVGYSNRRKVRAPYELFKDEDSEFFPRFDA